MRLAAWQQLQRIARPYHCFFTEALCDTAAVQKRQLMSLLQSNQVCQFGQRYGFPNMQLIKQYQTAVPIHSYQQLSLEINRILNGEKQVLFDEAVLWYERTSGTTEQAKMIPYTASALKAFKVALFPWLYDVLQQQPTIMQGSAYWSISPVSRDQEQTADGTPIGSHNDALYLGEEAAELIAQTLAVPAWVAGVKSIDAWQYITLRYLLSDADLSMISIWSPTFLLQLIKAIPEMAEQLLEDIKNGQVSQPELQPFKDQFNFKPDPQRALLLSKNIKNGVVYTREIWPKLALISCWSSASSQVYAKQLKSLFKDVWIQSKGLLATEGVITLPFSGTKSPVLAVRSGFYEFVDQKGEIKLAHQLLTGQTYTVLLTNYSGLYRYNIGDRVRVTGWLDTAPCLDFIGRAGSVSDLCGEKLSEDFVLPLLNQIPGFTLLVANPLPNPHYCLYVDAIEVSDEWVKQLSAQVERHLNQNPQYKYARYLGQLGPIKIIRTQHPMDNYYHQQNLSKSLGDVKPPGLSQDIFWHTCFTVVGDSNEQPLSV